MTSIFWPHAKSRGLFSAHFIDFSAASGTAVYSFFYYPLTLAPMMQYSCTMPELKYLSESNISRNLRRKEMKHITSKPDCPKIIM